MPTILQRAKAVIEGDRGHGSNTTGHPLYMPPKGASAQSTRRLVFHTSVLPEHFGTHYSSLLIWLALMPLLVMDPFRNWS